MTWPDKHPRIILTSTSTTVYSCSTGFHLCIAVSCFWSCPLLQSPLLFASVINSVLSVSLQSDCQWGWLWRCSRRWRGEGLSHRPRFCKPPPWIFTRDSKALHCEPSWLCCHPASILVPPLDHPPISESRVFVLMSESLWQFYILCWAQTQTGWATLRWFIKTEAALRSVGEYGPPPRLRWWGRRKVAKHEAVTPAEGTNGVERWSPGRGGPIDLVFCP